MTRWTMIADLERCVGCQTCTAACRHANATSPAVQWRKVLDVEAGSFPNVSRTFVPVGCQHCADPPCMHVCPTTATRQRADGILTIDYDLCIGCAYCEVACPYQARFLVDAPHFAYASAMENEIERGDPARLGVAQKCTFCSDRIDFGIANGLTPGLEPRATPACVNACIADALHFGDLDDPNSNVSRLLREQRHFRMHNELGTEPSFYYLYAKAGDEAKAEEMRPSVRDEAAQSIRSRGVEPWHQPHWNWKAAGNFLCGGAGTGLFTVAAVAASGSESFRAPAIIATVVVACGLLLLLFKIGRPLRSIYVLRQPQRSWMSREAWVVAVFFPLVAFAVWSANVASAVLAAAVGLLFLYCQAMILKEAKGIPAWRAPQIVPLIVVTGLTEGAGLFLILPLALPDLAPRAAPVAVAMLALVAARSLAWRSYLSGLRNRGAPARTLTVLNAYRPWLLVTGLAVPAFAIALGLLVAPAADVLFALGGLSAFAAGWGLKFILVTRAGYNQGFAINHTPVRGTGAAGQAVNPGWIFHDAATPASPDGMVAVEAACGWRGRSRIFGSGDQP
jgi:Fe-S-cluster-containing dehydrogenase component/DMSO reductase anchor subunit